MGWSLNQDLEKVEKLQLAVSRIVTGLTMLASRDYLYYETRWETLADRRN